MNNFRACNVESDNMEQQDEESEKSLRKINNLELSVEGSEEDVRKLTNEIHYYGLCLKIYLVYLFHTIVFAKLITCMNLLINLYNLQVLLYDLC